MGKIYNRKGKLAGYLKDNAVFSRRNELIGYVQGNRFLDGNFRPIAFAAEDGIYTMSGMPWAYLDGRVIRDMSGYRIGSVSKNSPDLIAAGSILGMGIAAESAINASDNYNIGPYGAQGGLGGSIFGGLGAVGSSINRFLFGGPRPMGYGVNPYYQGRYSHYNHSHRNHKYNDEYYNYSSRKHRHRREKEMDYDNRRYRAQAYEPVRHESPEEYYEQNNYESDRYDSNSYRQKGSGSAGPGIGRMLLNNIGPIASAVGRYMLSGSNLGNLGNLANMANFAGLGGFGNAAGPAAAGGFENMAPIISAMASMFGGAGVAEAAAPTSTVVE